MTSLGELIKSLRGKESLRDASERIGISHTYLDTIEKGRDKRSGNPVNPTPETLRLIATAYNYSYEELMEVAGYIEQKSIGVNSNQEALTVKEERDVAKRMKKMREEIVEGKKEGEGLNFMGEPMSDEAIDSLLEALEHAERIATLANRKYTPKKYKDTE